MKPWSSQGIKQGIKITPHDARHAYASMALPSLPSHIVARVLGHTTADVTYGHSFNKEAQDQQVRDALTAAMAGGG